MSLTIGPLRRRARVHYAEGFSDGWDARMSVNVPKYTVFQNVYTKMQYDDEPPFVQSFAEAFKSGRRHITDSFIVPLWYRQGTRGSFFIRAEAWMVPRHVTFKTLGLTKGKVGEAPWGAAYGNYNLLPTPPGTQVVRRTVTISWDNRGKVYLDEYDDDLTMRSKRGVFTTAP